MLMKEQRGFGMLEALISMVVIMIGVLGMAGMQMLAINNTENARYQSIAAMQASSMAAQMLANATFWRTAPATVTVQGLTVSNNINRGNTNNRAKNKIKNMGGNNTYCNTTVCTATEMAYFDVESWGVEMASALPSGEGSINCVTAVSPAVCTITMTWQQKNIALTRATGAETGILASGTNRQYDYSTMVSIQ